MDYCKLKGPELLLPAGSLEHLHYAFDFGADAVYAGQSRYSLRARNNEFKLEQLQQGVLAARSRGKKLFVASNIIPHNAKVKTYMQDMEPLMAMRPDALIGGIQIRVPVPMLVVGNIKSLPRVHNLQQVGLSVIRWQIKLILLRMSAAREK